MISYLHFFAISVICANIISFFVLNVMRLNTSFILPVYCISLIISYLLLPKTMLLQSIKKYIKISLSRREFKIVSVIFSSIFLLLILSRIHYFLEPFTMKLAPFICEGEGYLGLILSSIVNSDIFPIKIVTNNELLLSYYYAPYLLPAALYQAFSFSWITVKSVGFLAYVILTFICLLGSFSLPLLFFNNKKSYFLFLLLFMGTASGGDILLWIKKLFEGIVFNHAGHWGFYFGYMGGYADTLKQMGWSFHHPIAIVALFYAYFLFKRECNDTPNWKNKIIISLLLAASFFSSFYVTAGAIPFGIWLTIAHWRKKKNIILKIYLISFLMVLPNLWLYFGRYSCHRKLLPDMNVYGGFMFPFFYYPEIVLQSEFFGHLSTIFMKVGWDFVPQFLRAALNTVGLNYLIVILFFLGLMAFSFFYCIPFLIYFFKEKIKDKSILVPFFIAIGVLLVPFVVIMDGQNDLSVKGAAVAVIVFYAILAKYSAPILNKSSSMKTVCIVLLLVSFTGIINVMGSLNKTTVIYIKDYVQGKQSTPDELKTLRISQDRTIKVLDYNDYKSMNIFYLFKKITNVPIEDNAHIKFLSRRPVGSVND